MSRLLDKRKSKFFNSIQGLYQSVDGMILTDEEAKEYIRCAKDIKYFLENYYYIINVDRGKILLKLFDYQHQMVDLIYNNRFSVLLVPRQMGKSVVCIGVALHEMIFNKNYSVGYFAKDKPLADEMIYKFQVAYAMLPKFLQKGVMTWSSGNVELGNGSKITSFTTSKNSGRGYSFNRVMIDEFAFVRNNIQKDFMASIFPTLLSGTTSKATILSTPNGINEYSKIYFDSIKGRNEYKALKIKWSEHPDRDEKWKQTTIKLIGEDKFRAEYDCEFESSAETLIPENLLLDSIETIKPLNINILDDTGQCFYKVYKSYNSDCDYLMVVDVSRGLGADYTIISVFEHKLDKWEQAAIFRANNKDKDSTIEWIRNIAYDYENPLICVEYNGIGTSIADTLHYDIEYEKLLYTIKNSKTRQLDLLEGWVPRCNIGIITTNPIKMNGADALLKLFRNNRLKIYDDNTIAEFRTFVKTDKTIEASPGNHDDICMTFILFAYLTTDPTLFDLIKHVEYDDSNVSNPIFDDGSPKEYLTIEQFLSDE